MKTARLILLLLVCSAVSLAQANKQSFGYEVLKNPVGKLILSLKVEVPDKGLFLGVSIYPPGVVNTLEEGKHFSFPVKQGLYVQELEIDGKFENGTFEAALWTGKTPKEKCAADDATCQKLGFRHTGMTAYLWGPLRTK